MGKLFLAVLCASTLAVGGGGMVADDDGGDQIGLSPIPPRAGDQVTVTTPGPWPVKITVQFDNEPPFTITVSDAAGTQVTIPANAGTIVVTDPAGVLSGNGSVIAP